MTTDAELPGRSEFEKVCRAFGVEPARARLLHQRSNAVWRVGEVVVRLAPDTAVRRTRAATGIAASRWLAAGQIALNPLPGEQPVSAGTAVATFWPYCPSPDRPTAADIGELVRLLHRQPDPPFALPEFRPLRRLREALEVDAARTRPVLSDEDRGWLHHRADDLIAAFETTRFPLGQGLVHADVHEENVVQTHNGRWVLIDWDNACYGPRELDLVGTLPDHFHTPRADRAEFVRAYGYELLEWSGWPLLRDITEYHSLGAYIRLAAETIKAAVELDHRVRSLRSGDRDVVWKTIS